GRIFDGRDVFKRVRPGASPPFDEVQTFARAPVVGFWTEVRHVDDERIALPSTARVAEPLANVGRQVRTAVHDDIALPALALASCVGDGNAAGCLHDPPEAAPTVAGAKLGQTDRQATVSQRAVFRIIMAVHARGVVARRALIPSLSGRCRIVFTAGTSGQTKFAGLRRPPQCKAGFSIGSGNLLRLRGPRRGAGLRGGARRPPGPARWP